MNTFPRTKRAVRSGGKATAGAKHYLINLARLLTTPQATHTRLRRSWITVRGGSTRQQRPQNILLLANDSLLVNLSVRVTSGTIEMFQSPKVTCYEVSTAIKLRTTVGSPFQSGDCSRRRGNRVLNDPELRDFSYQARVSVDLPPGEPPNSEVITKLLDLIANGFHLAANLR